jgi:hypothetical protein
LTLSVHWEETENHHCNRVRAPTGGGVVGAGEDGAIANVIGHRSIVVTRDSSRSDRRGVGGRAVLDDGRMGRYVIGVRADDAR